MAEDMEFGVLVSLLKQIQMIEESQRCSHVLQFLDDHCTPSNSFDVLRLVIPELDRERGGYGLSKSKMSSCLLKILGIATDTPNATKLTNWNKNDGRFSSLAAQLIVQSRKEDNSTSVLTVKKLNEQLDMLAHNADKQARLATLIDEASHEEIHLCLPTPSDHFSINQDPRFYSIGSLELQSLLRKREDDVMLACKFTVLPQLKTNTSVKLDLSLEQLVFKPSVSFLSRAYTIYDGDRSTLDVWVSERKQPNVSPAQWTSLTATRVKTRFAASKFSEDNSLICKVLSEGVKTLLLSDPPMLFRLHAFFIEHSVDVEGFPHTLAVTSSDLPFENQLQVNVWDKNTSNKTVKGFFFIFGKSSGIGDSDMSLVRFRNQFTLPTCFAEGINRWCETEDIPEHLKLLIQMVERTSATPGDSIEIQDRFSDVMRFNPDLVLESLGCCFPWIKDLQIEHFLEKTCYALARNIQESAAGVADPVTEVYAMFNRP